MMHEDLRAIGDTVDAVVDTIVRPFANKVYTRFQPHETDDVLQELRITVWQAMNKYNPQKAGGQPDKYLRRSAATRLLDLYKGRGIRLRVGRQQVMVGGPVTTSPEDGSDVSVDAWAEAFLMASDSPEEEALVEAFLGQLNPRARAMLEARLDRAPWAEVADTFSCSSNNVIQILRRAYSRWAA